MGCCASAPANDNNTNNNKNKKKNKGDDNAQLQLENVKKLLFLGSGGCGKSTLFKQLRQIFGEIKEEERVLYQEQVWAFILETVQYVLTFVDDKSELSSSTAQEAYIYMLQLNPKLRIDAHVATQIKVLWEEELFQELFEEQAKVKLFHSCIHFLKDIERIGNDNYVPTDLDILFQRRPTTGLVEEEVCINETWFQIFDVGGQRNERRKWIHQFENVSAVVFVASLSSFDEPMYDDETVNSLDDSVTLFEGICDSPYFVHQHMILILNKQDLLKEKLDAGKKLKEHPATKDYSGEDNDLQACIKYVEAKFRDAYQRSLDRLRKSPEHAAAAKSRLLFIRVMCAYELESVKNVFIDVQGILTGRITSN